ncbi:serine/threonine-protein kinase PLK4-like, partial [Centruroides sculpturatus]|uniref:serine/threonine-protein kinase PLK4-like n=1 Tax=Centruroides sculpturatus TaxID=218467 RepID=UPI000C6EDBDB
LEENVTPKEDFQHCLHNFDDCICRSDCRCNKDSACVNQNHCHCRNYTNQAITGSHCCNNSRCYCRNAESGREHKSCQHSCDKIERHNQLNSCCESQHSVNSHSCCMRNGESIKQLSVHCSHHWYCNPSSKQCSHPEYCNCRKDLTRDRHLSHPSYDSPQTDSISIPSKDRDYRSDVTKDRNMSAGRQDRHRRTNSISSKEGADKAVRDKNDDKIQYLISPLKSTRLRPIRQKTKNAIVS